MGTLPHHGFGQCHVVWVETDAVLLTPDTRDHVLLGQVLIGDDVPDELPESTTAEQLDEAIQELPPEDQMLLQLYYFDQRPLKDIAYITCTSDDFLNREVSRLSSQLHRIRQRLRIILTRKKHE